MLTNNEMLSVNGGGVSWSVIALIGAAISFITGIIDGQIKLK